MTLDQAFLHAITAGATLAVYDPAGRLMGQFDPRDPATRAHLRMLAADDPSLVFEAGMRRATEATT